MPVLTDRAAYLLSAHQAQGTSSALDTRSCADYGFLFSQVSGQSAYVYLQGSPNNNHWFNVWSALLIANQTATAQIVGFYPYLRASAGPVYTGTGGATSGTGTVWMHYAPGIIQ